MNKKDFIVTEMYISTANSLLLSYNFLPVSPRHTKEDANKKTVFEFIDSK